MEDKPGDNPAMSGKAQILWIDDYSQRKKWATDLEDASGMKVEFISLVKKNVDEELVRIRKNYKPELVIIDHILDKTNKDSLTRLGSTMALSLREEWKQCPIFGITAVEKLGRIDIEKYAYDELIKSDQFSEYISYIPNVVEGFKRCTKVKSIKGWIGLLEGPEEEIERIKACMPRDLKTKTDIQKKGFPNRAYRWFRIKFYGMPGFLYNKDWVAMFIGVKKGAVDKYIKRLETAKYDGVFNDPGHPRWWKANLYKLIYNKCKKDENVAYRSIQDLANQVLGITEKERSTCYVCGEKWPETVAYVDETEKASAHQMHLRCTTEHPIYPFEPMFEEMRIMRGV